MNSNRKVTGICVAGLVVLSLLRWWLGHPHHPEYFWHRLRWFDALYGVIGCLGIVLFSKALGKWFLQRPEDYYDR